MVDEGIWRVCKYCGELQAAMLGTCEALTADVEVRVMDLVLGPPPGRDEAHWQHLLRRFTAALGWILQAADDMHRLS